eukprot:156050-Rhodomonas_salina.1
MLAQYPAVRSTIRELSTPQPPSENGNTSAGTPYAHRVPCQCSHRVPCQYAHRVPCAVSPLDWAKRAPRRIAKEVADGA